MNIVATLISPCSVSITWTTPPVDAMTTVQTELYVIEIQLISDGTPEEWVELVCSSTSSASSFIPSRGVNTTYYLRGHASNSTFGNSTLSAMYGPFVVYQDTLFPEIENISGCPIAPGLNRFSWSVPEAQYTCYTFTNFSIACEGELSSSTPVTVGVGSGGQEAVRVGEVSGLDRNSVYICRVLGTFTDNPGDRRIVEDQVSSILRTFTFPDRELVKGIYNSTTEIELKIH